tara:strand:+ start:73 stop:1110 length:1038 start_codon:yes stop_codon:yes gene_type:complete
MKKTLIIILISTFPVMVDAQFEKYIEITGKVFFEENNNVLLNPELSWAYDITSDNRIIDTNLKGHNVTIYNNTGKVINRFGQRGRGPGDFEFPIMSFVLEDGTILVSEFSGKLSRFSNNGDSLISVYQTGIVPLSGILEIGSNKILVIGNQIKPKPTKALFHIYNLSTKEIESSFFELPFEHSDYAQVFRMSVHLAIGATYNNKIFVATVPFKKLYAFSKDGMLIDSLNIDLENFVEIEENKNSLSSHDLFSYTTTFSRIEKLFFLKDGSFLVQYSRITEIDVNNPEDRTIEYNLAYFDDDRKLIFDINNNPELLGVDKASTTLYFRGINEDPLYLMKGKINKNN